MLPERIKLNEHAINLEDSKQPPYGPIYSLGPVELETLKTYIKTSSENWIYLTIQVSCRCTHTVQ